MSLLPYTQQESLILNKRIFYLILKIFVFLSSTKTYLFYYICFRISVTHFYRPPSLLSRVFPSIISLSPVLVVCFPEFLPVHLRLEIRHLRLEIRHRLRLGSLRKLVFLLDQFGLKSPSNKTILEYSTSPL